MDFVDKTAENEWEKEIEIQKWKKEGTFYISLCVHELNWEEIKESKFFKSKIDPILKAYELMNCSPSLLRRIESEVENSIYIM